MKWLWLALILYVVGVAALIAFVYARTPAKAAAGAAVAAGSATAARTVDLVALEAAAQSGDPRAERRLGDAYAQGRGVLVDPAAAARWYARAAEQDDAEAQAHLGWLYHTGNGVAKDDVRAATWLLLARNRTPQAAVRLDEVQAGMPPAQLATARAAAAEWRSTHEPAPGR